MTSLQVEAGVHGVYFAVMAAVAPFAASLATAF
jgi:hypothetical protein